jgi:uncharacterized protein with HEPN domain
MSPSNRRTPSGHKRRSDARLLEDLEGALADAEAYVLPLSLHEFLADRRTRGLARDVLNRIRTAAQGLGSDALRTMPELVPDDLAELRNLAVYEYVTDADDLVYRTLSNGVPKWRAGLDRTIRVREGREPATPLPRRADGSLAAARPERLCGKRVARTGEPCLLKRGHAGNCRSRLR